MTAVVVEEEGGTRAVVRATTVVEGEEEASQGQFCPPLPATVMESAAPCCSTWSASSAWEATRLELEESAATVPPLHLAAGELQAPTTTTTTAVRA